MSDHTQTETSQSSQHGHQQSEQLSNNDIFQENKSLFKSTLVYPPIDPNNQPPPWLLTINRGTESCFFKAAIAGVAGGGLGLMCGLFFGGYSNAVDKAVEMQGPTSVKLRVGFKEAARSMGSYAKSFARFGISFSAAECAIEKVRARHDIYNSIMAGCAAGAIMSASPKESIPPRVRASNMALGCASVAMFSAAIDYYMEYM